MLVKRTPYLLLLLLTIAIWGTSCKTKAGDNEPPSADSSYFSIRQFITDQIHTFYGAPYSLYRVAHMNDQVDSSLVDFLTMDWASIIGTFSATDISARKYLGSYSFSMFDDDITGTRGYAYSATDPDVFTRLLQINADPFNNRITSIYIETGKKDFFGNKTQKLLYIPLRIIQIQESEGNLLSRSRNMRVDYRFLQPDDVEQY